MTEYNQNTVYSYTDLDIATVTDWHLDTSLPTVINDNGDNVVNVQVDMATYMATGAGRYAKASEAEFVQDFFAGKIDIPGLSEGITKEQIITYYKNNAGILGAKYDDKSFNFSLTNALLDKNSPDYAFRTYIYNNSSFTISSKAKFFYKNGQFYVEDMAVHAFHDDFNLKSKTLLENIGNYLVLERLIDPNDIGTTIFFEYKNKENVATVSNYDSNSYQADKNEWNSVPKGYLWDAIVPLSEVANGLTGVDPYVFVGSDPSIRVIDEETGQIVEYKIGYTSYLTSSLNMSIDSIWGISGNSWAADRLITVGDKSYFVGGSNDVFRYNSGFGAFDYKIFNYDTPVFDSITNRVTGAATNSWLDFDTSFLKGIFDASRVDTSTGWLNGIALSGGGYTAWMPTSILNGDGFFNVMPSSMTTDYFRPGNFQLSSAFDFDFRMDWSCDSLYSYQQTTTIGNYIVGGAGMAAVCSVTGLYKSAPLLLNIDPLVLDMDGDGVELVNYDNSIAMFDVDNDGYIENTGWVDGDDAILVHDINGNGKIDNITETMSEYYGAAAGSDTKIYTDGLTALATLDSNHDGVFDANDAMYNTLRVWRDRNENAVTDSGEIYTLAELGITSINLARQYGGVMNLCTLALIRQEYQKIKIFMIQEFLSTFLKN